MKRRGRECAGSNRRRGEDADLYGWPDSEEAGTFGDHFGWCLRSRDDYRPGSDPNSPNSIFLVWTTDVKASSQASCGVVSGGPYTYASPTVNPVKTGGDDYYGVTAHSLAVVVPSTNTSSTAYFCRLVAVDSSGNSVTSGEVSTGRRRRSATHHLR
jgi:hypothetical protein